MASEGPRAGSVRAKLLVNTILALSFIAISAPQATRMPVHEWLSLAFMGVLGLHILFSWAWIVGVTRRFMSRVRGEIRFNYLLDAASYILMIVATISGLVISEAALPALGFPRPSDRFWSVVHDLSSEALLVLIGVHLAMHWDWVVAASRRLLAGALGAGPRSGGGFGPWLRPVAIVSVVSVLLSAATLGLSALPQAERIRAARGGGGGAAEGRAKGEKGARKARRAAAADGGAAARDNPLAAAVADSAALPAMTTPGATSSAGQVGAAATDPPAPSAKGEKRQKGAKGGKGRPAGGGGLGWEQRYLRPTLKIGAFMGGAFVLTLLVARVLKREPRTAAAGTPLDPLEQRAD